MNERVYLVPRSSHKQKVISKEASPLVHRAWTCSQLDILDFWWYGRFLLLRLSRRFTIFLVTSNVFSPSLLSLMAHCWGSARRTHNVSVDPLQWQVHTQVPSSTPWNESHEFLRLFKPCQKCSMWCSLKVTVTCSSHSLHLGIVH